jgi:hypothetical protein
MSFGTTKGLKNEKFSLEKRPMESKTKGRKKIIKQVIQSRITHGGLAGVNSGSFSGSNHQGINT